MRVRDLHAWLARLGWERDPRVQKPLVTWHHRAHAGKLAYHVPHGTDARELPHAVVRDIYKRVAALSGGTREPQG